MLVRTRICGFIFCHIRGHGVELEENYLDRIMRVSNAWNAGDIEKDFYPLYLHRVCTDGYQIRIPHLVLNLSLRD